MQPKLTQQTIYNQQAPDLNDPDVAKRLSRALPAVIRMLEAFNLTREEQAILLGLSPRTLQRALQTGVPPTLTPDQLTRMSFITGIYKAVHILFDDHTANGWLTRRNQVWPYLGRTPLAYLLQTGIPGLQDTRRLLDSERSGQFSSTPQARIAAHDLPLRIAPDLLG